MADFRKKLLRPWLLGISVVTVGMVGSLFLAQQQAESIAKTQQLRIEQAADLFSESLSRRLDAYAEIAFGLRSLFTVNPELDRRAFFDAAHYLEIDARYPGIKNLAFTRYITAVEKKAFEIKVRADKSIEAKGYPSFSIHPSGDRAEYFVADYLWPEKGNSGIHGLDISAQPTNLASMHYSRQTGKPVASGPFDLLQESQHRTGFVIRVPVFQRTRPKAKADTEISPPANAAEPRFLGSVAVTIRLYDLIEALEKEGRLQGLSVRMNDQGTWGTDGPTEGGTGTPPITRALFSSSDTTPSNKVNVSRRLNVYNRQWELSFHATDPFLSAAERRQPRLIGLTRKIHDSWSAESP